MNIKTNMRFRVERVKCLAWLNKNHTIIRAAFVCLCVRNQSPLRSFDGSSPNLVGVCRLTSHLPLRGSFSKRSTASQVNGSLSLSTILYRDQPHTTLLQRHLLLGNQQSLIRRLLLWCMSMTYVGGPGNCYWGVWKTSTGRRGDGSTGSQERALVAFKPRPILFIMNKICLNQRVTFTFTILYMIADDARLKPPRCKKHTAYDDTRFTPYRCKKAHSVFCSIDG